MGCNIIRTTPLGIGGMDIPTSSFDILFKEEFEAEGIGQAKQKAYRILNRKGFGNVFSQMKLWKYSSKRRMTRKRQDLRPYELVLLSLNRDIYRDGREQ